MSIISIVNQKGGTGKTTTSLNLGSALAKLGKKVLLIDMDSQGNLGYSLGLDEGQTIADVFEGSNEIDQIIQEREGMHIVPSDMRLVDIELSLMDLDDRHNMLNSKISHLSSKYDHILIDCPPSLSILAVNSLYASDKVIVPMLMEVLSLQGLDQIIQTIDKINVSYSKDLEILGILPVMVDKRRKLSLEVKDYILENYEVKIFDSMIRNNVKASEAPSFGQSVIEYSPSSNSAKDYMNFANEIVKLN
ncbi:ParA family protein [Ekhidna sp. To15]|uniref:ParA family protein n=1 Tax=Ekhidna sp. To15 TaxID=3395267 RepID=UPI003F527618